jgi:hypothetical protein
MVIALCSTGACKETNLGHAHWEVPIGTIRRNGFNTLINIEKTGFPYPSLEMSGLAPNAAGPNHGLIRSDPNYLSESYPQVASWLQCTIVEKDVLFSRDLTRDHNLEFIEGSQSRSLPRPYDISRYENNLIISPTLTVSTETPPHPVVYVELLIVVNGNNNKNGPPSNLAQRVVLEVSPSDSLFLFETNWRVTRSIPSGLPWERRDLLNLWKLFILTTRLSFV